MKNLSKYVLFAIVAVVAIVALSSVVHANNAPPKKPLGTEENFGHQPTDIMMAIAFGVAGVVAAIFVLLFVALIDDATRRPRR